MPCYHPLTAYQDAEGDVVFVERQGHDFVKTLSLPCGQCIGCRLERSRQWAVRCVHEAKMHQDNSFITLTYEDAPASLVYSDFQKFMKRLRKEVGPVRFYMCGEYGPLLQRPHFHACIFGYGFPDRVYMARGSGSGAKLYTSNQLQRIWGLGFTSVGDVSFETAAYTARYCMQKVTGRDAGIFYGPLKPEFNHMSLKPGIGFQFYQKFVKDIYPFDVVIVNGFPTKPPKYYDKQFAKFHGDAFEEVQFKRELNGRANYTNNTDERLQVREIVCNARINSLKRVFDDYSGF